MTNPYVENSDEAAELQEENTKLRDLAQRLVEAGMLVSVALHQAEAAKVVLPKNVDYAWEGLTAILEEAREAGLLPEEGK